MKICFNCFIALILIYSSEIFSKQLVSTYSKKKALRVQQQYKQKGISSEIKTNKIKTEVISFVFGPCLSVKCTTKMKRFFQKKNIDYKIINHGNKNYFYLGSTFPHNQEKMFKKLQEKGIKKIIKHRKKTDLIKYVLVTMDLKEKKEDSYNSKLYKAFNIKLDSMTNDKFDTLNSLFFKMSFDYNASSWLDLQLASRVDGFYQTGYYTLSKLSPDYDDIFFLMRTELTKTTIGTQKIVWGKMDDNSPLSQINVQDFRRFIIDPLEDRSLSQLAIRSEIYISNIKLDLAFIPYPRKNKLAEDNHYWSQINRETGEVAGYKLPATYKTLVQNGTFEEEKIDSSDWGLRLTGQKNGLDYGMSLQSVHQKIPYYVISEDWLMFLLSGSPITSNTYDSMRPTFLGKHQKTLISGLEAGAELGIFNLRFETTYSDKVSATDYNFLYTNKKKIDWALSSDIALKNANDKLILQLNGSHYQADKNEIIDKVHDYYLSGEWRKSWSNNLWTFKLLFSLDLTEKDYFIKPEINWAKWENQLLSFGIIYFDGNKGTIGDFYQKRSSIFIAYKVTL